MKMKGVEIPERFFKACDLYNCGLFSFFEQGCQPQAHSVGC